MANRLPKSVGAILLPLCLLTLQACKEGTTTGPDPDPGPVASSVTLSGFAALGAFLETNTLTATARDSDGQVIAGQAFMWTSDNESVASVADGEVTAVDDGMATITATATGTSASAMQAYTIDFTIADDVFTGGVLNPAGDEDVYSWATQPGDAFVAYVIGGSFVPNPNTITFSPLPGGGAGQRLAADRVTTNQVVAGSDAGAATGVVTVGGDTGSFNVEVVTDCFAFTPRVVGDILNNSLFGDDCLIPAEDPDDTATPADPTTMARAVIVPVTLTVGTEVTIKLESLDFDANLMVFAPDGAVGVDDDGGGGVDGTDSRIHFVAAATGTYTAVVTSYFADEIGDFTFSVLAGNVPVGAPGPARAPGKARLAAE